MYGWLDGWMSDMMEITIGGVGQGQGQAPSRFNCGSAALAALWKLPGWEWGVWEWEWGLPSAHPVPIQCPSSAHRVPIKGAHSPLNTPRVIGNAGVREADCPKTSLI